MSSASLLDSLPPYRPVEVQLWRGDTALGGKLYAFGPAGRFMFVPDLALRFGGDHRLVVTSHARSDAGVALAAPVSVPFTVENPPPGAATAALTSLSFQMIEYQYPGSPDWYYTPVLRVAETHGGVSSAHVERMVFSIPGIDAPGSTVCAPSWSSPHSRRLWRSGSSSRCRTLRSFSSRR